MTRNPASLVYTFSGVCRMLLIMVAGMPSSVRWLSDRREPSIQGT